MTRLKKTKHKNNSTHKKKNEGEKQKRTVDGEFGNDLIGIGGFWIVDFHSGGLAIFPHGVRCSLVQAFQ